MSWFRRKPSAVSLLEGEWRCTSCGELHTGLFDLAADAPDPWPHPREYEPNSELRLDGDFLSEDFCVLGGEYFFVRAVLRIPVTDLGEDFGFGCWSTLARPNFDKYCDGFDDGKYADPGPWFGWLCNQFERYIGTEPLAVSVQPQWNRQRPSLTVNDETHPLAIAQRDGITVERLLEILAFYGHAPEGV